MPASRIIHWPVTGPVTDTDEADVVLLAAALAPPEGWLERLADAAYSADAVAGAAALIDDRGVDLTAPRPDAPSHPRVGTLAPVCAYLRRDAIDLVGFPDVNEDPAAALSRWCSEAMALGLGFVLADDLVLAGEPEADPASAAIIEELGPLRRVHERQRQRSERTSVTIDARALGPRSGGTQSYTAALVLAMAATGRLSVRAVVAHDAPEETTADFGQAGVEVITYEQAVAGVPRTDLLHLPHQVFGAGDLNLGRLLSDRLVMTHLDLIAFHNPTYHASSADWLAHRRMTQIGMATADTVVFTSLSARDDALAEELLEPERSALAGIGVTATAPPEGTRPAGLGETEEFVLVLGADYAHKNRPFAIRLFRALRENHDFRGRLVFAGRHMAVGGTAAAEAEMLAADPTLGSAVSDLGPVAEAERDWLIQNATALFCPSHSEGYGLTPLEAAAAGTPSIYAAVNAHAEILGASAATIEPWNANASAAAAVALLRPGPARERHLVSMRAALQRSSWQAATHQLEAAYERALAGPFRGAAQVAWDQWEREQLIDGLDRHRRELEGMVGNALSLAGRGGLLSAEQQLGLIRVASRPRLARPLLKPFAVVGGLRRRH